MLTICPLSKAPQARSDCIRWTNREWGASARFQPEDWAKELDRIEAHPVDEVFVAFEDKTPVGMAWMLEQEGVESHAHLTPWLSSLVVDPAYRDRGVARALLDHVEKYVALGGDETLYLLTETPAVYFTKGWEVVDTAPLGHSHVFVMHKTLAKDDQQPDE